MCGWDDTTLTNDVNCVDRKYFKDAPEAIFWETRGQFSYYFVCLLTDFCISQMELAGWIGWYEFLFKNQKLLMMNSPIFFFSFTLHFGSWLFIYLNRLFTNMQMNRNYPNIPTCMNLLTYHTDAIHSKIFLWIFSRPITKS